MQQRHLTWSDFNERSAAPSPASAALLAFFEIRFARKVPGGLVYQEAQFAASTQVHRARLVFLTTNRVTSRRQLLQQRLRLLQIARVEPFGEPTVIDAVAGMPDSENGAMAIDDFFGDAAAIALLDTLGALPP